MRHKADWNRKSRNNGYVLVYCPGHPRAWSTGYVYEHILVAEEKIGRLLGSDERVHHRDRDKTNNRAENLEVWSNSWHVRHHAKERPPARLTMVCAECGIEFRRRANQRPQVKGQTNAFCSRSCNGRYQRRHQMGA